jgi:dipeptidyl aminopeptidase/acylaminoacyl peptidase
LWLRVLRTALLLGLIPIAMKILGVGERLFYWPSRTAFQTPAGVEDVSFESEGLRLHGWFYRATDADPGEVRPVVVHAHGNAFNISRHDVFADFLPREGFHVLIFDYRGYGRSERGPLNRDGLVHDALAAVEYARGRPDTDPDRVGLYGLSLGGTIALAAAAEDQRVAAVCSVATFSRWKRIANGYVPLLGNWLIRDGRDAEESVTRLGDRPLLLLHGTDDEIVPFEHGPMIRDAALASGARVEFREFEGAGHVDWIDSEPAMREAIAAFFTEHLRPKTDAGGEAQEKGVGPSDPTP